MEEVKGRVENEGQQTLNEAQMSQQWSLFALHKEMLGPVDSLISKDHLRSIIDQGFQFLRKLLGPASQKQTVGRHFCLDAFWLVFCFEISVKVTSKRILAWPLAHTCESVWRRVISCKTIGLWLIPFY